MNLKETIVTVLFTAQPVLVLLLIGFVICFGLFLEYRDDE